jgi:phospholipase C
MPIKHFVVLMLENRSFDSVLGRLYSGRADFDGLTGDESNVWHQPGGDTPIPVWSSAALTDAARHIPDPDPGESFADIHMQIHGIATIPGPGGPTMGGFVDNYMRQPNPSPAADPRAVMHYFENAQLPVLSGLARAFAVSDRWFASAPCQTWPNRFFAHCCTAGGYVNNAPIHVPFGMPTVFNAIDDLRDPAIGWRIYHHDMPQTATLWRLWDGAAGNFRPFEDFLADAASNALPSYSFIEPRYYPNLTGTVLANDGHPPHDIADAEQLVAQTYNALRAGAGWNDTLLLITCDEHGGCYDHVPPPPAVSPDGNCPDGFDFGYYGVRVPAVIVSPHVRAGSVIRPAGAWPFDHTSISATLHALFGTAFLTSRDRVAPHLLADLTANPDNQGPARIDPAPSAAASAQAVLAASAAPPNDLQASLAAAAARLPTGPGRIQAHLARLRDAPPQAPAHATAGDAATFARASMKAFLSPADPAG